MIESTTNSTPGDGKVSKGGLFDYFKDTTTRTPTSTQSTPSEQSQLMVAYKKPKLSQYVDHKNKCSFMVEFDGKMHPCGAKTDKHNVGRRFRDKETKESLYVNSRQSRQQRVANSPSFRHFHRVHSADRE